MQNVLPSPSFEQTEIFPPKFSNSFLAIDNPKPLPPVVWLRDFSMR